MPACGSSAAPSRTPATIPRHAGARAAERRRLALRSARERRPLRAPQEPAGAAERRERQHDEDHADDVAVDVAHPDGRDAQVRLRREQLGVVQHQRRAEVVDDADEREQRAGDVAGQRERQRHAPEETPAVAAEHLARFLRRRIDAGERGRGVQQDEREVVERLHEDDARQAVHERHRDAERVEQEQVHEAAAPEDLLEGDGADERRDHERQHRERLHDAAAGEVVARDQHGERQRDDAAERHGGHAGNQRVDERLDEEAAREERAEVREGRAVGRGHRHGQHGRERPGDEDEEQCERREEQSRFGARARAEQDRDRQGGRARGAQRAAAAACSASARAFA